MPYNSFWVSLLSIKEGYFPSINAYEYERKCMYPSSFILPIFCNGQECYIDMLIFYFVFHLSPSISLHLFSFSVFQIWYMYCLVFILELFF